MIWTKLQINTTFTGLSAVSGLRYGGVAEQGPTPSTRCGQKACGRRAQGLELERDARRPAAPVRSRGLAQMMRHWRNVRPSMLQDLDAGRETEVDVVNGGVARKGRELGIPTPYNDAVVELVHSMERGERTPDPPGCGYVSEAQITSATDELNPGRHPGRRMQLGLEAVVGELARDQQVEDEEADGLRGDADEPEDGGVVEAVPARAGEVDREVQDQAERRERRWPESRPAPGLPSITSWPSLPGREQVEHDEADRSGRRGQRPCRPRPAGRTRTLGAPSQSAMTCGTNRERLLVTSPSDSRMPSPAGSMSTVHTPSTGRLPS